MTLLVAFIVCVVAGGIGIGLYCQSIAFQTGETKVEVAHDLSRWDDTLGFRHHESIPSHLV